ncbi:hypothetical protein CP556_05210 [Natrinema sp. CBA1119]|nr:hypothetical protein CP556_05210 [Natrinema sp. CBA1119]
MEYETHPPVTDEQTIDTLFALLRNRYRRDVVDILSERESSMPLHDLAAVVATAETGPESDRASTERTHEVAATLHHSHLPKLDDADIVDYDTETHSVTPVRATALAALMRSVENGR